MCELTNQSRSGIQEEEPLKRQELKQKTIESMLTYSCSNPKLNLEPENEHNMSPIHSDGM